MKEKSLLEQVQEKFTKKEDFAVDSIGCKYYMEDGRRCGIGILLPVFEAKKLQDFAENESLNTEIEKVIDEISESNEWENFPYLTELYKKHGLEVLKEVQDWHDIKALELKKERV